jgi:N-carbamoylputrescine amidase
MPSAKPSANTFTLGLVQLRCEPDPAANLERALSAVRRAASNGAEVICLGNLPLNPAFWQAADPDHLDLAEPIPGPTSERLAQAARDTHTVLATSLFERRDPGMYHDTAVVFEPDGGLLGLYRRTHLTDGLHAAERYYFAPGDLPLRTFETSFARVAVLPGWDQWFPEAARLAALQGAEVLLCPGAFGRPFIDSDDEGEARREAWELTLRAHAVANGVYVAAVNRVGHEGPADAGLEFWGSSFVSDPLGLMLGQTSEDREEVLVVPCDRRRLELLRRDWPFLRDRRPDVYTELNRRWLR